MLQSLNNGRIYIIDPLKQCYQQQINIVVYDRSQPNTDICQNKSIAVQLMDILTDKNTYRALAYLRLIMLIYVNYIN